MTTATCEVCNTTENLVLDTLDDGEPCGVLCRDCGKEQQRLRVLECWRCGETRGLVVVYHAGADDEPADLLCRICLAHARELLLKETD